MTPEQLWEKYADLQQDQGAGPCTWSMSYAQFLAALAEYGEAVRAEAVKVCDKVNDEIGPANETNWGFVCAAAIEKMKLP